VPSIAAGGAVSNVWKIGMQCYVVDVYSVPQFVVGENITWLFVIRTALISCQYSPDGYSQGNVNRIVKQAAAIRVARRVARQQA